MQHSALALNLIYGDINLFTSQLTIVFWMNEKISLMKPLTTTSWLSKQQKQTTNQAQLIA